jgi:hypothetical protein
MYIGRQQSGSWLDVYLQVTDVDGEPAMPDHVPQIKIRNSAGTLVVDQLIPVVDKTVQVGIFCSRLFLGAAFATGMYSVTMLYRSGVKIGIEERVFEIMAGGDAKGTALAMTYYHKPHKDFIVYQTESGTLEKGSNPRVN